MAPRSSSRRGAQTRLAAEPEALGRKACVVALDVRDAVSFEAAVRSAALQAGHIDVLVNNAGVAMTKMRTATRRARSSLAHACAPRARMAGWAERAAVSR